jgi:hypothetical protein
LSFIICFDHQRWYVRPLWTILALAAIAVGVVMENTDGPDVLLRSLTGHSITQMAGRDVIGNFFDSLGIIKEFAVYFVMLFLVCMVCHGELVRLRPHPRHLTEFYLLIAAGGAVGGIFVGLLAPMLFKTFFEWPIALAVGYLIAAIALGPSAKPGGRRLLARASVWSVLIVLPAAAVGWVWFENSSSDDSHIIARARNFYGVLSVREDNADEPLIQQYVLMHGRITHGVQFTDPEMSRWPISYYGPNSGVAKAVGKLRVLGKMHVGVVGLGTGTMAAFAEPGDRYTFYDINPAVRQLALTKFTYLRECRGRVEVKMGDARLSLEQQPPQHFNLLVLDAFSGDAIPTHLLTKEAFEIYQRHRAPGGVIAVHISNRYLDLSPVVRGLASQFGMKAIRICDNRSEYRRPWMYCSDWMLVTDNEDFLKALQPEAEDDDDSTELLWTDQYNNLFQILQ